MQTALTLPYPHLRTKPHSPQLQKVISRGPAPQKPQNHSCGEEWWRGRGELQASHARADIGLRRVQIPHTHSATRELEVEGTALVVFLQLGALMASPLVEVGESGTGVGPFPTVGKLNGPVPIGAVGLYSLLLLWAVELQEPPHSWAAASVTMLSPSALLASSSTSLLSTLHELSSFIRR